MSKKDAKKLGRYQPKYVTENKSSRSGPDALVYQFESKHGKDLCVFGDMVKDISEYVKKNKKKGWKLLWHHGPRYAFEIGECLVEIYSWDDDGGPHGVTLSIDHDEKDVRHEVRDILDEIFS